MPVPPPAAVTLTVISAGFGRPSTTRLLADRLADAVGRELDPRGQRADPYVIEVRELARALADDLVTGVRPAALSAAVDAVTTADAVIAATPVCNGSYSGLFKTFLDVLPPGALDGTPVLLAATGGSARHTLVLDHALRPLFSHLHAVPAPTAVYAAPDDWAVPDALTARVTRAAAQLAALLPAPRVPAAP